MADISLLDPVVGLLVVNQKLSIRNVSSKIPHIITENEQQELSDEQRTFS